MDVIAQAAVNYWNADQPRSPEALLGGAVRVVALTRLKASASADARLGASRHPGERFRGNQYPAVIIERSLSVEGLTRQVFD